MDIVEWFKIYAFCVYLFYTVVFWIHLLFLLYKNHRGRGLVPTILFFIAAFISIPVIWPLIGANMFIKRLAEGK